MSNSATDLANWNWAEWTFAFIVAGLAWMLVISFGLAVAGTVKRIIARRKKRP